MRFSQRIGKTPANKKIQLESMDDDLRNSLWNTIKGAYLDQVISENLHKCLWRNLYKEPVDQVPSSQDATINFIREVYFNYVWHEVYDFIEFMLNIDFDQEGVKVSSWSQFDIGNFIIELNEILERESSAYRIMDKKIIPISNELEFDGVNNAISATGDLTALTGANLHLNKALDFFSDKKSLNYRNSIKESISAVEATCRIITGENTLGKALKKLEENGLNINAQFRAGLEKTYAYANDRENGIRHAIVEQPNEPDYHDAKYLLVLCSAFINYLIGKADKARIPFDEN